MKTTERTEPPRRWSFRLHVGVHLRETHLGHAAGLDETLDAFQVELRPFTSIRPGREFSSISIGVEPLDEAIDPAEAERLFNRLSIRKARSAGVRDTHEEMVVA